MDGKHHAVIEAVAQGAVVTSDDKAAVDKIFFLVALFLCCCGERFATCRSETEPELADGFVGKLAFLEITQAHKMGACRIPEQLLIVFLGIFIDDEQALTLHPGCDFLGSLLFLDYLNAVFLRQVLQGLRI